MAMAKDKLTFGSFLRQKRKEKEISLRKFAEMAGLSPVHLSYLETGQRPAPKSDALERIAGLLCMEKGDEEQFYDLAAESASTPRVSGDLPEYIMGNNLVRAALRTAKDVDATDDEWMEFIGKLRERSGKETGGGNGA